LSPGGARGTRAIEKIGDTAPIGFAFLSADRRYLQINQRLTETHKALQASTKRFCLGRANQRFPVQPLSQKDFCFQPIQIISLFSAVSCPLGGAYRDRHERWARDAVDADALLTNSAEADGEVVWS
jgi:hypothetical protein